MFLRWLADCLTFKYIVRLQPLLLPNYKKSFHSIQSSVVVFVVVFGFDSSTACLTLEVDAGCWYYVLSRDFKLLRLMRESCNVNFLHFSPSTAWRETMHRSYPPRSPYIVSFEMGERGENIFSSSFSFTLPLFII